MRKFMNLFKKEIKELISAQLILSLAFTVILFYFIGNMAKTEMNKIGGAKDIYILNLDDSDLSGEILRNLALANFKINLLDVKDRESAVDFARKNNINLLLIIPEGFGPSVLEFQPEELEVYSFIRSFSVSTMSDTEIVKQLIGIVNNYLSDNLIRNRISDITPEDLKNPIKSRNFIVIKDRMAEGSVTDVANFVYFQSIFIPIILMMVITFSSQMVLSAIAMEKQDKTLETLLTVPISRNYIVMAKMFASGLIGLLSAGIYMIGFRFYMGGFTGNLPSNTQIEGVIDKLGLRFTSSSYMFLGISLFLAILCALAIATILGALTDDLKSAQSAFLPLMFLVLIPYFISIFSDINSLSLPLKILILAIPFSHPFLASQNLLIGNYHIVFYGILYMSGIFVILIFIAGKIFSTDRILTMKLRFRGRRSGS